jgi:hypothetical protein
MTRSRRSFASATSYYVTMRCNNQAFDQRLNRAAGIGRSVRRWCQGMMGRPECRDGWRDPAARCAS